MKLDLKTLLLTVLLGTIFYFLSNKKENKTAIMQNKEVVPVLIDKNPSKSIAPKPYIYHPQENGLTLGGNWRSK